MMDPTKIRDIVEKALGNAKAAGFGRTEQIEHAVKETKRHGIERAHGFFLVGSPGETEEDILESRRLLDACIARCRTDKQRARARLMEKAFQYYEASALAYLGGSQVAPAIETEVQALEALNRAESTLRMWERCHESGRKKLSKASYTAHMVDGVAKTVK